MRSIIEEFYQSLRLDGSDEKRIADANQEGVITSYHLTTKSAMNGRRVNDLCLWCGEVLDHNCENAPRYNCWFTFGEDGEGIAFVTVPKHALKTLRVDIVQDEAPPPIAHKVFDEMPEPVICSNQSRLVSCENNKPITCHFDHDDYKQVDNKQNHSRMKDETQVDEIRSAQTHHLVDEVHGFRGEYDMKYSKDTQLLNAHKVLEEMPLPDFIREMGRSAKVEGDKSGECDHQQHIGCNSAEDEGMPNARHMLDKMCELGNESIPAVTIIEHENTVMPTSIKVTTKPFLQFAEIENWFSSPDKIFGSLVLGERVNNTSQSPHFQHNYDLLCVHCIETEYDCDVTIPKWPIWFHPFNLTRLSLLIDFIVYGLQICLLQATCDPELIIFDPGGCWSSLVLQNMLDGRRNRKCLFANLFRSMYNPKVSVVMTDVSILLDCFCSITLEDKGVFKGRKEDNVHMRPPCRLQCRFIIRPAFIPSGIKQMALFFNHTLDKSSFHCQRSLWNDLSQTSWLPLDLSLSSWACKVRCDNANNTSSLRSDPYIMVLCKTSLICLNIAVQLSTYLYPPRVVATLDALVYFLPIVRLSYDNVVEILDLSLSFYESADGGRDGVYDMGSYKLDYIGFLCYKFRGGASIQVFTWNIGDKIIIVELLRRLNVSSDSLVAVFRDIEVETSCWRNIILCYARAMKCWVANSRKLNVTANEFMLTTVEQSRCFIPLSDLLGKAIKRARKLVFHHKVSIITRKRSDYKVGCDVHWIAQVSHFVFDPGGDGNGLERMELHQSYKCGTKQPKAKRCEKLQIFVFDPGGGVTWLLTHVLLRNYVQQI